MPPSPKFPRAPFFARDGGHARSPSSGLRLVGPPRWLRSKLTWLAVFSVLLVFLLRYSAFPSAGDAFSHLETKPQSFLSEDGLPPIPRSSHGPGGQDGGSQSGSSSSNNDNHPAFHLLVRRRRQQDPNPELCRTIFSSMVLDYPPVTLIERESNNNSIESVDRYLSKPLRFKDDDVVLIVDEPDTWFQLPSEILVKRFYAMLAQDNKKLRSRYGMRYGGGEGGDEGPVQAFSERIIFGADKVCHARHPWDAACAAVPFSTLMPDVYGEYTDISRDAVKYRPRWLNSGAVMGLVGDVRLLYNKAAQLHQADTSLDEQQTLAMIYGEQEYAREAYRLLVSRSWVTRFAEAVGILDTVDISNVTVNLATGRRHEFSIGLDYKSDLFFTMLNAENDVDWLRYNNVTTTSDAQRIHKVPRESRLILPEDIEELPNPFAETFNSTTEKTKKTTASTSPGYSKAIDKLPPARNASWHTVLLATNVRTARLPPVLHVDRDESDKQWRFMWFHPWSRSLLRKYLRSTQEEDVSVSSLQDGVNSWDARGGKGGIWTAEDEWKTWPEVCQGFETKVFRDDLGPWGEENGIDQEEPVYNQWGQLVSGVEKK